MRVLHVTHQYRPTIGGAEQYITNLSEELAQRGHGVTVYTSRSRDYTSWQSELPPHERLAGVDVYRFRSLMRGPQTWRLLDYGYRHYWRTRSRRYEPFIFLGNGPVCPGLFWSTLRHAPDYDLIHISHLHYAHAATAFWATRWQDRPVVITPHLHIEQPVTYEVRYLQAILKHSQHVVAVTPAERQFLIGAGIEHQSITTAGNGIRPEEFPILSQRTCRQQVGVPEGAFVLLFLGRKTEYKGLDLTLKAFAALRKQYPELYLLAVGPETEYSQRLLARYKGLPGLVNHSSVSDENRLAALNACDCLVMPSTGEAFGVVFLEAWAVSKPVVGARTGAVSSVITDGQDGYLIAPGDVAELAERIVRLLQQPALALDMGKRGRAKVYNRYTVPRIADIVEGVYTRVLRRYGHRAESE